MNPTGTPITKLASQFLLPQNATSMHILNIYLCKNDSRDDWGRAACMAKATIESNLPPHVSQESFCQKEIMGMEERLHFRSNIVMSPWCFTAHMYL